MIEFPHLPPPTPRPCSECPWRRVAAPGWLGPHDPAEWVEIIHGEQPIACHMTIPRDSDQGWSAESLRQCRGAAIYRANVCKSPVNPTDAEHGVDQDEAAVFASDAEFLEYHSGSYDRWYRGRS